MEQWTIREQLILGSAVQRSGDQNWVSVSRTIRPLSEENRQPDFYSQKNCAMHYAALLDSASTPKRKKKRGSESETGETTQDLIVRELTEKRLAEINQLLDSISNEYHEVKKDLELIEKGQLSDDEITNMWNKIKDVDYNDISISHTQREEESDKQEQQLTSDKGQLETISSYNDKPFLSLGNKLITSADTSKANNMATPLIATPIIAPVGSSATLIKIEPNVAMETIGGGKPVQVKILSHDDHTYSSPGPPTLLTTTVNAEVTSQAADGTVVDQASHTVNDVSDSLADQAADDQTSLCPDQNINPDINQPTSVDQSTLTVDKTTPAADHPTPTVDQPTPSVDQPTPSIDQPTPTVDQPTPTVDQPTPSVDQPTPTVDQLTVEQLSPKVDQGTCNIDQAAPSIDKVAITDQDTATIDEKITIGQDTPTDDQATTSADHANDQIISTVDQASDVQAVTPMDNQTDSSTNQATSINDHTVDQTSPKVDQSSPKVDQSVDGKTDQINKDTTPTTTDQATLTIDQIPTVDYAPPVADQGTTHTNQKTPVSDQTVPIVEKKSRTRGSNRIAGKMKMAQIGKAKTVKATSPRTMVIIGKQQSAVESDNEEIQVHYKEPTRRIHRLMSNEPSESEEEPLSAVTSAMTSPSSSMIDEIDPEVAQTMKLWRKSIMLVWQHASQHKYASLFLHAVKDEEAAGYSEVVFRPMDLSLIKKKIETGVIRNDMEFQRDMLLMFQNAIMYNSSNHDVYMMADEMRKDVMDNIQDYLATQLMVHSNARTKILRSRDSRRVEQDEELPTPLRRTRHRLPSDESVSSISGAPLNKKMRTRTNDD